MNVLVAALFEILVEVRLLDAAWLQEGSLNMLFFCVGTGRIAGAGFAEIAIRCQRFELHFCQHTP